MYSFLSHVLYVRVFRVSMSRRVILTDVHILKVILSTLDGHLDCLRVLSILVHVFWYAMYAFLLGLSWGVGVAGHVACELWPYWIPPSGVPE